MGHQTAKSYRNLQRRLDAHAQGAPESPSLYRLLEILFTEREAELVSRLPFRFFTVEDAARRWREDGAEARRILDELADKGILLDVVRGETQAYILAPTMAGFFEFSLMRLDDRFDKGVLSELFHQYINEEDAFVRQIFGLKVPIDRVLVQERAIPPEDHQVVLDYERASHVIRSATAISVGVCYCRHKMGHMGKACSAPLDVCLTLNNTAQSLIRHGIAREISVDEGLAILERCIKRGLVQIGDNVQQSVNWICNCCGCCCEAILAYKRLGFTSAIHSSYVVEHAGGDCADCTACVKTCPTDAIIARSGGAKRVTLLRDRCFGCGVCVRYCKTKSLRLVRRSETSYVPVDSFERMVVGAIETGKLPNYIFDNESLWTHTALRRLLAVLMELSPVKRAAANQQLRSRFVQALSLTRYYSLFDDLYNAGRSVAYTPPSSRSR
ncbi:MAG: (Fe-S)-binding protein [Deltaproteobacteria bacterium]|jgi:Pyruvate/2-oxoacid:ferredoxin oxidoreductase delta subunit|nr:(Fe-S)-binding protein [Deltaproteobacteria bacterium]MBW2529901.1 (Fe-S)-binding protein [Deltaproteobacteria bacterium]